MYDDNIFGDEQLENALDRVRRAHNLTSNKPVFVRLIEIDWQWVQELKRRDDNDER